MRRTRPLRRLARRVRALLRFAVRSACAALALILLWVGAYRWIDPPTTYYIEAERLRQGGVDRAWRDLDAMSPHLPRAALAAEDAGFCAHWGFDLDAIRDALDANAEGGRLRGGSTISQQVAKNVFLWPERSWTRKGLEAGFTLLIEAFWPKRRIVEVYLNVAEFGPGVFGAEAGARAAFGAPAADLGLRQSARLAAILPDPKGRSAARPSGFVERRARSIADGAETLRRDGRAACLGVLD